jgi:Rrf2 family nitric oxide-sensitive transcriptional repressor
MQLSRFTDYSLRVLLYLGVNNQKKATLSEVAEYYDISLEHLRKVVHELAKLGYIKTYRGKYGGFEINQRPNQINIGEVVAQTEGTGPLLDCDSQPCRLTNTCTLKSILVDAQKAFFNVLYQCTLEDLLKSKEMQKELRFVG